MSTRERKKKGAPPIPIASDVGRPLEGEIRRRMESAFQYDFSSVRIHTDDRAAEIAREEDARAFTIGEHIGFAPGEFRPSHPAGEVILAHELAHVIQQRGGEASHGSESHSDSLERDADRAAAGALTGTAASAPARAAPLQLQRCPRSAMALTHPEVPILPEQLPEVDAMLRRSRRLARWLGPRYASPGGPRAASQLHLLSTSGCNSDYDQAYGRYAARFPPEQRLPSEQTAGFTDMSQRPRQAFLPLDVERGTLGNAVHEAMHLQEARSFADLGRNIHEGATEFFATIALEDAEMPANSQSAYRSLVPPIRALANVVGLNVLGDAYFLGNIGGLRAATDASIAPGTFDRWVELMRQAKLDEATALMSVARRAPSEQATPAGAEKSGSTDQ